MILTALKTFWLPVTEARMMIKKLAPVALGWHGIFIKGFHFDFVVAYIGDLENSFVGCTFPRYNQKQRHFGIIFAVSHNQNVLWGDVMSTQFSDDFINVKITG
ncbi:hypothetical protein TNIN_477101 [Trichonephila inaurata madagascariensis]|uniref:Uncharacterized protein n=1 Tax=Trichonephila inaurata madagascariensis TaxID=2747483 RepID=A0A8X6YV38_9ARAC|nr:hypothetical protein TNIN_477101 [Trichonephila inaurata madagascariensis]